MRDCTAPLDELFPGLAGMQAPGRPDPSSIFLGDHVMDLPRPQGGAPLAIRSLGYFKAADMDTADWRRAIGAFLRTLRPADAVRDRQLPLPPHSAGLQIRRTDHWPATAYSPLELFIRAVELRLETPDPPAFFLTTDCPSVRGALKARFGGLILTRPGRLMGRREPRSVIDAAADLWSLASCGEILASCDSTFGEVSGRIGGKPVQFLQLPWRLRGWNRRWLDNPVMNHFHWDYDRLAWRLNKAPHKHTRFEQLVTLHVGRACHRLASSEAYQHFPWSLLTGSPPPRPPSMGAAAG